MLESLVSRETAAIGGASVVAFGTNVWDDYWMPPQQYLPRLAARGWQVIYVDPILTVWDRGSLEWRRRSWTSRIEPVSGIRVFRAGRLSLRWPSRPIWDAHVLARIARHVRALTRAAPERTVLYVIDPGVEPILKFFPSSPVVYFAHDAYSLVPGWSQADTLREERVVDRAELIVTCSRTMAKHLPSNGEARAHILPNGVDYQAFSDGSARPCPDDLAAVPHPRIGYTGSVNLKVDFGLVYEIAVRRPEWNWVLVGPVGVGGNGGFASDSEVAEKYRRCTQLPNVHFLGRKPVQELPAYIAHMDVNAMCYRLDGSGWWKAIDPLKTKEYLAAGKPIVSVGLENVQPFADCVSIVAGVDEWLGAVDRAICESSPESSYRRQARARANDWELKTDELSGWMRRLLPASIAEDSNGRG